MKKIAVITGASSGMGRRFAETVREWGSFDEVWCIARRADRLEELKATVPFPVKGISLDLTDRASFAAYAELLKEEQVEVGLLVNASGFELPKSFVVCAEPDGQRVYLCQLNSSTLLKRSEQSGIE